MQIVQTEHEYLKMNITIESAVSLHIFESTGRVINEMWEKEKVVLRHCDID